MKQIKKVFISALILAAVAATAFAAIFYWKNLRGSAPAVKSPPEDISEVINTTAMPLKLPAGFSISIFAKNLQNPRVMTYDPLGNIIVSVPSAGKVVALPDKNNDGIADEAITVAEGLNRPHGLATRCPTGNKNDCKLYIAEPNQVGMYDYDTKNLRAVNKRKIIDLPDGGNHFTRTIMFGSDGKLYIAVGSSCNVCEENDWRRAKILVANWDGSDLKVFASGLRNSVFMAPHPATGKIWATEMGRDFLGDDMPPDEINIIEEGRNYGWPICYGKNMHDSDFDKKTYIRNPCMEPFETPSYIDIPAHSAPLGLAFFPEEGWPEEYRNNLLVAYHGSWNRSVPTGYKIVRYKLDPQGNYLGQEDFVTGWLTAEGTLGRPVDILIQPGGIIYVSDDKAGVIYRLMYKSDKIIVDYPRPGDIIKSPLIATGRARGPWFFEASFPVRLLDANGKEVAVGHGEAQSDWMTQSFVPFQAKLEFETPLTEKGTLVLEKDNPSALPEHADELRIPVRFR
ncbi:MAG: PQQ-dependent sugar dehydrogenase [Parcubacteria group bacterium]|nr:PQQ-dependent sugar dehydrogenase [Parcubacteria group bacterium]